MAPCSPSRSANGGSVVTANMLFLNEIWIFDIVPGSNGPFWSISYEFWYYALFGAAIYFRRSQRLVLIALVALVAGPNILVALPVWLIGVATHHTLKRLKLVEGRVLCVWLGSFGLLIVLALSGATAFLKSAMGHPFSSVVYEAQFLPKSVPLGLLIATNIVGFDAIGARAEQFLQPAARWIRKGADASFSMLPVPLSAHVPCESRFNPVDWNRSRVDGSQCSSTSRHCA